MKDIRISVIVPVYNVEKYLRTCIDSLLSQNFMPYEIILVDDGSTDTCPFICDEYANANEIIKVIHKKNAGLGYARNTGIENANGDYITFVDSDDYCDHDYIETFIKEVEKYQCDTCKTSYRRVNDSGEILSSNPVTPGVFADDAVRNELLPRIMGSLPNTHDAIPLSACATLFSLEIINEHGLKFPSERAWISEDTMFNIYYYSYAKNVVLLNQITYNYRVNNNSLTTKYVNDRLERCIRMYRKELEIFKENGVYDYCHLRATKQFFNYLRMCFAQLNKDVCKLDTYAIINEIETICKNKDVISIIDNYPVEQLDFAAKVFLKLVRNNHKYLLYFIYNNDLFRRIRV